MRSAHRRVSLARPMTGGSAERTTRRVPPAGIHLLTEFFSNSDSGLKMSRAQRKDELELVAEMAQGLADSCSALEKAMTAGTMAPVDIVFQANNLARKLKPLARCLVRLSRKQARKCGSPSAR